MSFNTVSQRFMALSLVLVMASCSATRHPVLAPTGSHDLARYVLVIEKTPDGQVTHSWKTLGDVDLTQYEFQSRTVGAARSIMRVSTADEYCRGRFDECLSACLASRRPIQIGHLVYPNYRGPWNINKGWWCQQACTTLYSMCINGNGPWAAEQAVEFTAIEPAVEWIKNHREEILVGTVVVIAGVAFVAAVMASGGGVLYFAPLIVLAERSPAVPIAPRIAEAAQ